MQYAILLGRGGHKLNRLRVLDLNEAKQADGPAGRPVAIGRTRTSPSAREYQLLICNVQIILSRKNLKLYFLAWVLQINPSTQWKHKF